MFLFYGTIDLISWLDVIEKLKTLNNIEVLFMTQNKFLMLCEKYFIDVGVALENEALKEALLKRDDELVEKILIEDF